MSETKEFKAWHKLESARRMGTLTAVEEEVDRQMRNTKVEVRIDGKWTVAKVQDDKMEEPSLDR
jgi:hypothetical protein